MKAIAEVDVEVVEVHQEEVAEHHAEDVEVEQRVAQRQLSYVYSWVVLRPNF